MLITTIILFAIAAVLGLILIAKVFQDKETPNKVVYSHGLFAATALILLVIKYVQNGHSMLLTSLLVFTIAAIGGFVLFGKDISGNKMPKWLATVHALAAVIGFITLLIATFL